MYIFTEKSGRYSAFLIKMIYALVPPLYWIRFTIFAAGILFFYCCVRISEKMTPTGNKSLPLSITLFTGIYLIQTKIWESFFWGGGGQIYSWGILCAFASWIALFDSLRTPSKLIRITALSLAFLSCGFAELINIAMIFIAISFVVFSFSHQAEYSQYQRKQIMHFLIVLIISSIIAFAMPGNYANATRFVEGGSISGTFSEITLILIRAIKDAFLTVYAHTTVQSVQFLLLGGICFLLGAEPKVAISDAKKEFLQALGILILLVLSSIASVTLNGILQFTPTRIGSVPLSIIWIGYSYFLFKLGTFIGSLARHESIRTQAVFPGLIIGICLWLSFYFDAQPQLYRIYHAWNQRDSELRQIAAEGNFDGEELETCAIEINGTTLTDFPYDSYGFLIGRYYGLPTLYADDKCNY